MGSTDGQAAALAQILQVIDDSQQMQMLLGVLKGGGDLPGSLSGIPQLNSQPHQQALAQADVLGIHKEDIVHIGHVCGQPGALAVAGQLMGDVMIVPTVRKINFLRSASDMLPTSILSPLIFSN